MKSQRYNILRPRRWYCVTYTTGVGFYHLRGRMMISSSQIAIIQQSKLNRKIIMNEDQQKTVVCPECGNEIPYGEEAKEVGFVIECPTCLTTLEVVAVDTDNDTIEIEVVEEEK